MNAKQTILILEDNPARVALLQHATSELDSEYTVKVWNNVPAMKAECEAYFSDAALISLDHDLNPEDGATVDPGTGVQFAQFLGDFMPACPVIVHSQNTERVWSMVNELRFAGWTVQPAGGMGTDWSEAAWLRCAREMLKDFPNTWNVKRPADHAARIERMLLSLDGLGIGDALGEMLSYRSDHAVQRITEDDLPAGPWFHTDDTEMAISITAVLKSHGFIDQEALAKRFARRFERDPDRGYGSMTRSQMREIIAGAKWQETASNAFRGQGSMGNGSAMRVAPLGAYFADDVERCVEQARLSSLVTHTHSEGVAGAIAVAVASAMAWQLKRDLLPHPNAGSDELLSSCKSSTQFCQTRGNNVSLSPRERAGVRGKETSQFHRPSKSETPGTLSTTVTQGNPEQLLNATRFFETILQHTPESKVRRGILVASTTPPETPIADVARALGNGSLVTAPDTVPFCIWMAAHHLADYVTAIAKTISAGGDCDTNAAIVGGIVALSAGRECIPAEWLQAREPIQV